MDVVCESISNLARNKKELEDDMSDLFELFDYEIKGRSMYVDFKNWHEGMTENRDSALKKVAEKAKKCNSKCVAIINIYAEKRWDVQETDIDGVHIVLVPRLVGDVNGNIMLDKKAVEVLKRCFDEYKH